MPKQYIAHWSPIALEPSEVLHRVEPIFAAHDFTYSGAARRLERGADALYYELETLDDGQPASDTLRAARARGWTGVALRLIYRGYYVPLSIFFEHGQSSMLLDEDSPLFYEQDESNESAQLWSSFLLELTTAIGASLCLFEKDPAKRVLDPHAFAESLMRDGLAFYANPIVAIVHESLLPSARVRAMHFEGIKIRLSTGGYSVFTWMGPS